MHPLCNPTTFGNLPDSTEIASREVGPVLAAPHRPEQLSLFGVPDTAPSVGPLDLSGPVLAVALSAIPWLLVGYLIWMLA